MNLVFAFSTAWALGLAMLSPMIGASYIPMRVKLAFALAIGGMLALLDGEMTFTLGRGDILINGNLPLLIVNFISGAVAGFVLRLAFSVFETIGTIVANAMSLMQLVSGQDGSQASVYTNVAAVFASLVFLSADGHIWVLTTIIERNGTVLTTTLSFDTAILAPLWIADLFSSVLLTAFALSLPFLFLSIVYYLCLGVISRLFPQFMAIIVGAPALVMGAMMLFALLLPFFFDVQPVLERVLDGISDVRRPV